MAASPWAVAETEGEVEEEYYDEEQEDYLDDEAEEDTFTFEQSKSPSNKGAQKTPKKSL